MQIGDREGGKSGRSGGETRFSAHNLTGFLTNFMIFAGFLIFIGQNATHLGVLERFLGGGGLRVFWAVQCA